jgi:hypothetical protein
MLREELTQYRTQSDALQLQVVVRGDEEARSLRQQWGDRVRARRGEIFDIVAGYTKIPCFLSTS